MAEKKCKIISASKVQHIECECGYTGLTHTGDCPNCHATELMSDSQKSALSSHRANISKPVKVGDREVETHVHQGAHSNAVQESLRNYERASNPPAGGAS